MRLSPRFIGAIIFSAFVFASAVAEAGGVETYFEPIGHKYGVGDRLAALPLKGADGAPFPLEKTLGKKVIVLTFWFDVCDDCIEQMKELKKFIRRKGWKKRVSVVAVTRGSDDEEIKRTLAVARARKISFDIAFDPNVVAARTLGVIVVPSSLIIDEKGVVRTPPIIRPGEPIRDMDFFDLLTAVVRGKTIPPLQFVAPPAKREHREMIGRKAPDFTLEAMDGRRVGLKDYRGKSLLVYFWHPNCSYCKRQISRLQTYYEKKGGSLNFEVVALAYLSTGKDRSDAGKVFSDHGVTYPFLVDGDKKVGGEYRVDKIPVAYFIDGGGIVREVRQGQVGDYDEEFDPVFDSIR